MVNGRHKLVVSVFYMVTWLNTQVAIDLMAQHMGLTGGWDIWVGWVAHGGGLHRGWLA